MSQQPRPLTADPPTRVQRQAIEVMHGRQSVWNHDGQPLLALHAPHWSNDVVTKMNMTEVWVQTKVGYRYGEYMGHAGVVRCIRRGHCLHHITHP